MLVELSYVFFSFLFVIYSVWCYFKRKDKHLLHLTLCLAFLAMSVTFQMFSTTVWFYRTPIAIRRFLELSGLALYTGFTVCTILVLRKISETHPK